jgi:hypothetical protein
MSSGVSGMRAQIHPTTRQHALIAKAVHELAGHLFT